MGRKLPAQYPGSHRSSCIPSAQHHQCCQADTRTQLSTWQRAMSKSRTNASPASQLHLTSNFDGSAARPSYPGSEENEHHSLISSLTHASLLYISPSLRLHHHHHLPSLPPTSNHETHHAPALPEHPPLPRLRRGPSVVRRSAILPVQVLLLRDAAVPEDRNRRSDDRMRDRVLRRGHVLLRREHAAATDYAGRCGAVVWDGAVPAGRGMCFVIPLESSVLQVPRTLRNSDVFKEFRASSQCKRALLIETVHMLERKFPLPCAERRGNAGVWRDRVLQSARVLLHGRQAGHAG